MYESIRKFIAPEFLFGAGCVSLTGRYAKNFGAKKVFVATDPGLIKFGHVKVVTDSLEAEKIPYVIFSDIVPNPRDFEAMAGAAVYKSEGCNLIIAIGGGSVMDCAKAIGIVSANGGDILQYEGADKISVPCPPLICVPTTAGSSADVSQFAIITDTKRKVKIAIVSKTVVPDVALIDHSLTATMDPFLTACTGLDALTHAFEAYVSNASSRITDLNALKAVSLVASSLEVAVKNGGDMRAREDMMLASLFAGMAFSNASLGIVHAMAHSLGGFLDIAHGESNALLLPYCVRFNFESAADRYRDLVVALGGEVSGNPRDQIFSMLSDLNERCGISGNLKSAGLNDSDIPILAEKAFNDVCLITNPREASISDIEEIYRNA